MDGCLLVGTDGGRGSLGALRVAGELAKGAGLPIRVAAVLEPPHPLAIDVPDSLAAATVEMTRLGVDTLRRRVVALLREIGGPAAEWPVSVEVGPIAPTLDRIAREAGAGLIVVGLRRHSAAAARLGRPTPLRLLNLSSVPVLAVPPDAASPAEEVVVAVDFSEFSTRAAERVADFAAHGARVHLAHVMWGEPGVGGEQGMGWLKTYRSGARRRLDELARSLRGAPLGDVRTHLLETEEDPPHEILRLAAAVGADLIVAGSHGAGFFDRVLLGSVSSRLMHGAECAVLLVPPS